MIRNLKVSFDFAPGHHVPVGDMLRTSDGTIFFQFAPAFLAAGKLSPSPIKLRPLVEPQTPNAQDNGLFAGVFGVFADSLPDGWGLMMMSRAMRGSGIDFNATSALDRLAFVGRRGLGALVYEPAAVSEFHATGKVDLAKLAGEAHKVLDGKAEDVLPELLALGGSPGGARPKVMVGVEIGSSSRPRIIAGADELPPDFAHWLIKFRGLDERRDAGVVEYIYAETARHVGLNVPDTKIFTCSRGQKWFGIRRFDRVGNKRIHVHTAAGMVHANFRLPSLDYEDLLKITGAITRRDDDVKACFRMAAFNVVFHNRDDHAKNFSFMMSDQGVWRLAPSYDLTFSMGPGGEHTTAILGEGRSPGRIHLTKLAAKRGMEQTAARAIIDEVFDGRSFMEKMMKEFQVKNHPLSKILVR